MPEFKITTNSSLLDLPYGTLCIKHPKYNTNFITYNNNSNKVELIQNLEPTYYHIKCAIYKKNDYVFDEFIKTNAPPKHYINFEILKCTLFLDIKDYYLENGHFNFEKLINNNKEFKELYFYHIKRLERIESDFLLSKLDNSCVYVEIDDKQYTNIFFNDKSYAKIIYGENPEFYDNGNIEILSDNILQISSEEIDFSESKSSDVCDNLSNIERVLKENLKLIQSGVYHKYYLKLECKKYDFLKFFTSKEDMNVEVSYLKKQPISIQLDIIDKSYEHVY